MGFDIPLATSGRLNWTNEFKAYAVARVLGQGEANSAVAKELGVHDNLLRKWVIAARRARRELVEKQPHFEQLYVEERLTSAEPSQPLKSGFCKLTIGDAVLEFSADIETSTLL